MYSEEELAAADGKDGRIILCAVNGKVRQYTGDKNTDPLFSIVMLSAGQHVDLLLTGMKYDPKYGIVKKLEDMSYEQCCQYEDFIVQGGGSWECVGTIEQLYSKG